MPEKEERSKKPVKKIIKEVIRTEKKIEIKEAVNIDLDRELMNVVRHYKIDSKKKLYEIFDEAIREYLRRQGIKI